MPAKQIWQKHRKFLIQVTGGLAVFMGLLSVVSGFQDRAERKTEETAERYDRLVRTLEQKLDNEYDRETEARKVLAARNEHLLGLISLVRNAKILPPGEGETFDTDFPKQVQRVQDEFADRADKLNLGYPREVEFDLRADLTDSEWVDRYRLLDVLDRFYRAAVDHQVSRIESIRPLPVETEVIPQNPESVLVRYPVRVEFIAEYSSVLGLMESFQRDREFIGVELSSVERLEDDEAAQLKIEADFVGLAVGEPREESGSKRRPWRRRGTRR